MHCSDLDPFDPEVLKSFKGMPDIKFLSFNAYIRKLRVGDPPALLSSAMLVVPCVFAVVLLGIPSSLFIPNPVHRCRRAIDCYQITWGPRFRFGQVGQVGANGC
jgi:hypothetical protein